MREILERVRDMPLPEEEEVVGRDLRRLPGGVSNVTHGEAVRRGVGYAVGFKNIGFSAASTTIRRHASPFPFKTASRWFRSTRRRRRWGRGSSR